jgi:hypothetical protein
MILRLPEMNRHSKIALSVGFTVVMTLNLAGHARAQGIEVWATAVTRKVRANDPVEASNRIWSSTQRRVRLAAAANEVEGFHLVIRAGSQQVNGLGVTATRLTSATGAFIAAEHINLFREAFFVIPSISAVEGHPLLGTPGSVPDALVPLVDPYGSNQEIGVPFSVSPESNQPIWVSISVPPAAPAGAYEGQLAVTDHETGAELMTVSLEILVHDFSLPSAPSIHAYYNINAEAVSELHQETSEAAIANLMARYYQVLADRRLGAGYAFFRLPSYSNQTGFDWSHQDAGSFWTEWLDQAQMPTTGIVPIYDSNAGQYRITRPNGSPYTQADLDPDSDFVTQARRFYRRLWDDLSARVWLDKTVVYMEDDAGGVSDEPYDIDEDAYDRARTWAGILHSPDPQHPDKKLRLLVAGDSVIPSAPYADLRGFCDIWDMYMDEIDFSSETYQERLAEHPDEELWIVPNAYGDFIDYPAVYHRTLGWFAFKHGATGIEQWDVLAWYDATEELVDPWVPGRLSPVWGWGGGGLLWPGTNIEGRGLDIDGPISSLRLELQHQSLEDYEYLTLLTAIGEGELARELAIGCLPGALVSGLPIGPDQYERARALAMSVIDSGGAEVGTLTGTVRSRQGEPIAGAVVGNGTLATISAADGRYGLTVLPGLQTINCTADGYLPVAVVAEIGANQTRPGIDLEPAPVARSELALFGSFESSSDLWEVAEDVTVTRDSRHVTDGSYSMHARFNESGEEPSIATEEIIQTDWSSYDLLELDIYCDSTYLSLLDLEIADESYRYFTGIYYLRPGEWRTLSVPIAAMGIDTTEIVEIVIYVDASGKGSRDLHIDAFRLVRVRGADTSSPGSPQNLQAVCNGDAVDLSWSPPAGDAAGGPLSGLAGYHIYRREAGGPFELLNQFHWVVATTFRDYEIISGTKYLYQVRAYDQSGNQGPASTEVTPEPDLLIPRRPRGRAARTW